MSKSNSIRCAIYRGGTSKGVMFREADIPADQEDRTRLLLRVFGSPDLKQIDGLGGATPQTSKAMIVGPSTVPNADVQMTFGQVSLKDPTVAWNTVCGNMTSAVGPFAINEGMVAAVEPFTSVRIYSVNSKKYVTAVVPVRNGRALSEGDFVISGVPGTGARIDLHWLDPAGSTTEKLLPTGKARDEVTLADGRQFQVSIVDAGNLTVFCDANQLALRGTELPAEFDANREIQATIEELRGRAAVLCGLVNDWREGTQKSPGTPKIGFAAAPVSYKDMGGTTVEARDVDVVMRLMSATLMHKSYMGAGAVCTSAAAAIPGTIVHELCAKHAGTVRIGHPAGVMESDVVVTDAGPRSAGLRIVSGSFARTARRIMEGVVYL
jgi:2-methylaconitate cis-trans-isomerase PrpF